MVSQVSAPLYRSAPGYLYSQGEGFAEAAESTTSLPLLRSVLNPEIAALPHVQLVEFMESEYGEGAAEQYEEYLEGFFGDVGKFFKKAAPIVTNIAGGVIKGASTGAALGLPGIIGGAVAGGVGQGFSSYGKGTLRDIGKGLNTGLGVASQFSPTGRIGGTIGGAVSSIGKGRNVLRTAVGAATNLVPGGLGQGGAATALTQLIGGRGGNNASQLLGLLQRPEVMQALAAMAMGPNGRTTIPVGAARRPVPASAFAGLINRFAQNVMDEQATYSDGSESDLGYLMNDAGEWIADPAESDERAAVLYEMLNVAELERLLQDDQESQWYQMQQQEKAIRRMRQAEAAEAWELEQEAEWYEAGEFAEALLFSEDLEEYDEFDDYDESNEFDEAFLGGEYDELDEFSFA